MAKLISRASKRARRKFRNSSHTGRYTLENKTKTKIILSKDVIIEAKKIESEIDIFIGPPVADNVILKFRKHLSLECRDYLSLPMEFSGSKDFEEDDAEIVAQPGDISFHLEDIQQVSETDNVAPFAHLLASPGQHPKFALSQYSDTEADAMRMANILIRHRMGQAQKSQLCLSSEYFIKRSFRQKLVNIPTKTTFLCYHCCRVLQKNRFAKGQISGEYLPGHAKPYKRFCISCGIQNGKFKPGNHVTIHGWLFQFCKMCSIPTLGRFCTRCNTCSSCLGFDENFRPKSNRCPRCKVKTFRIHADLRSSKLLQNLEQLMYKSRAFINVLASCGCDLCMGLIREKWTIQPHPMDLVQQELQFEIYHFSQISRIHPTALSKEWQPAIFRIDKFRNVIELGYEDPVLNVVHNMKASRVCYLRKYGSASELMLHMESSSSFVTDGS